MMNISRTFNWWIWVALMTMAALLLFATNAASSRDPATPEISTPGALV